jgi:hypothetical protein
MMPPVTCGTARLTIGGHSNPGGGEKNEDHYGPKPLPESGSISSSGLGVDRSRYGEMLPS